MDHGGELAEHRIDSGPVPADGGQRSDAQLDLAWLDGDPHMEVAAEDRLGGLGGDRVREQLGVGQAIGAEVGAGGECADQAGQDGARETVWRETREPSSETSLSLPDFTS